MLEVPYQLQYFKELEETGHPWPRKEVGNELTPATLPAQETSYPQQEHRAMQNRCKEYEGKLRLDGRWVASPWNPP